MNIEEAAAHERIEQVKVFQRAKSVVGTIHDTTNPDNDFARWKAYGDQFIPDYVKRYLAFLDKFKDDL